MVKLSEILKNAQAPVVSGSSARNGQILPKPRVVGDILRQVQAPITKSTIGQATSQAIDESAPGYIDEIERKRLADYYAQQERETGQEQFSGLRPAEEERFEIIPAGIKDGVIQRDVQERPEVVAQRELREAQTKAQIEAKGKLAEGQRAAERTLGTVSGVVHDFSKTLAEAYESNAIGDVFKATKTALRQKIGGKATRDISAANAIPGQKVEIITKMMPLLTQQGDKPGSVRLVSTVFEKLSDSLPGANLLEDIKGNQIDPVSARRMLKQTLSNMFRFSQAITSLGITNEQIEQIPGKMVEKEIGGKTVMVPESGSELSKVGDMIERVAENINLSEADQASLNNFIETTLKPLDDLIARQEQGQEQGLTQEEQAELMKIEEELARLGG